MSLVPSFLQNTAIDLAFKVLTPVIIGIAVRPAVDLIKKANKWIDAAPAYVKQGLAVALAALATFLTHLLGVPVPADLAQWDAEVIKILLAALIAIFLKQAKQLAKK